MHMLKVKYSQKGQIRCIEININYFVILKESLCTKTEARSVVSGSLPFGRGPLN